MPTDARDATRWREQAKRRRMLHGQWSEDAKDLQRQAMGLIRSDAHGPPDLSSNVFAGICRELGIHYNDGVTIGREAGAEDQAALDEMTKALAKAGHAATMRTAIVDVIGIREIFVRVSERTGRAAKRNGRIMLRPVYPDCVVAYSEPDAPDVPVRIEELRHRQIGGVDCWTWDVLDVSDPNNPIYQIHRETSAGGPREDVTALVLGERYDGDAYPYRIDGEPILPYAVYHASVWPALWGYTDLAEVVDGTLRSAIHWTFFGHALRNASWPQRVAIDLQLAPAVTEGDSGNRLEIKVDPATVLQMHTKNDGDVPTPQGGRIDSWTTSVDLLDMFEAVIRYERKVASGAGVSASDFERQEGDPRSAYALLLSSDGKVRAARAYTEGIRRGDLQLLEIVASILGLPADGWTIAYPAVPDALVMGESTVPKPEEVVDGAESPDIGDAPEPPIAQDPEEDAQEGSA